MPKFLHIVLKDLNKVAADAEAESNRYDHGFGLCYWQRWMKHAQTIRCCKNLVINLPQCAVM